MSTRKTPRTALVCIAAGYDWENRASILAKHATELEAETQELAEVLRDTVAILEEWHADMPDHVGHKEPAILSAANAAIARHKANQP